MRAGGIGDLSRRTGVNVETIRYYERVGVLPKPARTEGGQRAYDEEAVKRLAFVARSRQLGFSLDDIRSLLGLVDGNGFTCADVRELTLSYADEARRKIADLRKIERTLRTMAKKCLGDQMPDCPIIDTLFRGDLYIG